MANHPNRSRPVNISRIYAHNYRDGHQEFRVVFGNDRYADYHTVLPAHLHEETQFYAVQMPDFAIWLRGYARLVDWADVPADYQRVIASDARTQN